MVNKLCVAAWERIGTPSPVLDWIQNGIRIPFNVLPTEFHFPNPILGPRDTAFINEEVDKLLQSGSIELCENSRFVSPICCVPKKNGKLRLVHNLKHLNSFCNQTSYRNEDIREVANVIQPNDFMITQDGFHHVPVHVDDRDYLAFQWNGRLYRWRVLPFGLCCSPYYFSKFLRPVVKYLRSLGVRLVVYVDDFILMSTYESVTDHTDLLTDTLQDLGVCINFEKSVLTPSQTVEYIGYSVISVSS